MNTAFLKSVFSVEQFARDYRKFLSNFCVMRFRNISEWIFERQQKENKFYDLGCETMHKYKKL